MTVQEIAKSFTGNAETQMPEWRGFKFLKHYAHASVRTCDEAIAACGVQLHQELKTIILKAGDRFVAVHLRADRSLNSKKVKKAAGSKHLRFAKADELAQFGLELGRVNPGNTQFCGMQLVCNSVFSEPFVTTNSGRFDRGVAFAPADLLSLPFSKTGDYSNE